MKQLRAVFTVVSLVLLSACATIHSRSISHMEKGTGHRIIARNEGYGYFMLSTPSLDAATRLRAQCAGNITGVVTTLTSRNWFVIQHFEETAEAWCQ
jgi:hypothetical protein